MIYGIWEALFLLIILCAAAMGTVKGGLRTLTFFSAHLFPLVLALVFTPFLGNLFVEKTGIGLSTWFPVFLIVYVLPMILLTQLFRVMYRKAKSDRIGTKTFAWRLGGFFMGLLTGALFAFLFTWLLLLQPWISSDFIYGQGGTVFSHTARLLQLFMRFYV